MAREPSWETVARVLADRMSHQAHCDVHPEADADPDCPFCKDRAAYRVWQAKSGQTHVQRLPDDGPYITLGDLLKKTDKEI